MARKRRRTRCWTRKTRRGKSYVVCDKSSGQKRVYKKKRRRKSKRLRKRGGRRKTRRR